MTTVTDWWRRQPRRRRVALVCGGITGLIFGWFPITVGTPEWTPAATPSPGLDPSWITAINLAPQQGLRFGSEVIWTYGPWGRLDLPLVIDGWALALGLLASILVTGALGALVAWALGDPARPAWAPYLGIPLTGLLVFTPTPALGIAPSVRAVMLIAGLTLVLLTSRGGRFEWSACLAASALAGALLTVKFSEGLAATLLMLVATAFLRLGWRRWLALPAVTIASLLLAWLLAWQRPGDLLTWLSGSLELARGYPSAMATQGVAEAGHPVGLYLSYAGLVILALIAAVRWRHRLEDPVRWAGLLITVLLLAWIMLRVGFTQEGGQLTRSYVTLGLALLILLRVGAPLALQLAAPIVASAIAMSTQGSSFAQALEPVTRVRWALDDASAVISGTQREALAQAAQQAAEDRYQLPQPMVDAARARPTHVDSTETTLAWAYGIDWRPLPVFQAYSVWTRALDERNAAALGSPDGPELVLREPLRSIHDRQPLWDQPLTQLTLICRYRAMAQEQYWLLLERSVNRCGPMEVMYRIDVEAGEQVLVPPTAANEVLLFSIEPKPSLAEQVVSLAFKPPTSLRLATEQADYRLVPGTVAEPMIARIGILVNEWSPQFGGRFDLGPFRLSQPATITFAKVPVS